MTKETQSDGWYEQMSFLFNNCSHHFARDFSEEEQLRYMDELQHLSAEQVAKCGILAMCFKYRMPSPKELRKLASWSDKRREKELEKVWSKFSQI